MYVTLLCSRQVQVGVLADKKNSNIKFRQWPWRLIWIYCSLQTNMILIIICLALNDATAGHLLSEMFCQTVSRHHSDMKSFIKELLQQE